MDYMDWGERKCRDAWHWKYTCHHRDPTIVLEAVALWDLWLWHCLFGLLGYLNDINVLRISHLFVMLASGDGPACN
jgi:hypothetical protein